MPRQFLDSDKKQWLVLYESGKSEKWIAREHAKCDPRTVKKGIEEARRKQDARTARAEILKDALRRHQDSLLEELDRILPSLVLPAEDYVVVSWYPWRGDIQSQTVDTLLSPGMSESRVGPVRRLLKQHLRNDRLWRLLAQQEKAYMEHAAATLTLQQKTVSIIEEKTGSKLVDRDDVPPPFVCSYTTGDLFFRTILRKTLGTSKSIDLETDIVAKTNSGDVVYHGLKLAKAPGDEKKTKRNLLDALATLEASSEVDQVADAYEALKEATMKARQVIEQIKLLGLIPGQCEICQRLGI